MNRFYFMLTALVLMLPIALVSQLSVPRSLFIRIVDIDGSSMSSNITGLSFEARLNGVSKSHEQAGFGFVYGNGNMYARIQLGNFGVEWLPGDTIDVRLYREYPLAVSKPLSITIPEGSSAIWWGAPPWNDVQFPGEPAHLYPVSIHISSTPSQSYQILKDGKPIGNTTNTTYKPESIDELTGLFSLEQPSNGFHWEPSQYNVTLNDLSFTIDYQTSTDLSYCLSIGFKLCKNIP